MINGNIDEFVEKLLDGEKVIYVYHGKSIFRKVTILMMERIISNYSSGNQQRPFYGV